MKFVTSLDTFNKVGTIAILIAFVVISAGAVINNNGITLFSGGIILSLLVFFLLGYGFYPRQYIITADSVIVKPFLWSFTFPKSEIKEARKLDEGELNWSVRTFGVSGLFGYYGFFYNRKLGAMTWFATKRNDGVLLETKGGKKIILTPDQPEAFVNALK